MQQLKKELLLNTIIISFFLSILLAWIGALVDGDTIGTDKEIIFLFLFLIYLAFYIIVSIISFLIGVLISSLPIRLFIFNGIGLISITLLWQWLKDPYVWSLLTGFIIFSIVSTILKRKNPTSNRIDRQ